jgi:hypothetical protein
MPAIKFKIMQNHSFKSADELIQGIKLILSKNRCSFSDDERVLLNDCVKVLEQSKTETDEGIRVQKTVKVLSLIIRVFTVLDHLKDLF